MSRSLTAIVIGHGKFRSNFCRFKISDDPICNCFGEQTVHHLPFECNNYVEREQSLRLIVTKRDESWFKQWQQEKTSKIFSDLLSL